MYNYLSIKIDNNRSKSQGITNNSTGYHSQVKNTEIKSRNLNSSTVITDYANRTNQTNASTRISNYNLVNTLDHLKSYNN